MSGVNKSADILWKTTASETKAREQEGRPDPGICGHAFADHLDVGSNLFTERRNLIHKRNARSEECIRRIFQHLGGANIDDEDRSAGSNEGSIKVPENFGGPHIICPDNDPVWFHEVINRGALLQELRVR